MTIPLAVSPAPTRPTAPAPAFALLGTVQIVLISGITVISVALPAIQDELRLSGGDLALVSTAYGLAFSGLLLLGGRLADLYGRRRVFMLGLGLFGVSSAAAALAPGLALLLTARFAQGIGAALAAPSAMALLGVLFPDPHRRARATAVWGGLAGIGATGGMLLSGVFAEWASWRWAFGVPATAAALAIVAAPRLLPADRPVRRARIDILGAALVTAGLSTLSYGLVESSYGPLIGGVVLLLTFMVVESRTAAPLVPPAFFAAPRRAVALAAIVLGSAGMATSFFFLSLHLQQVRGLSPLLTSAAFLPYGAVLIGTGAVAGRLLGRFGVRIVLTTGLIMAAAGLALVSRFDGALVAGLLVLPFGIGLTFAGATVAAVADVPDEQAGLAGGVVNTAMEIGPTLGLAVLVSLAAVHAGDTTSGYGFALGIAAVAFILIAPIAALLLRTPQ
ncbi:MFS family permease [Streptosporangium album]|uniref:MFS family permease n=1 Tax=Streptosporangium album TaxID=47479 RepID=A0A7W7W9Y6_9ACTN|nr:MFS transporter [Streptosporangium album]MBB4938549.1 MFS family permease [Streptosporangium album]